MRIAPLGAQHPHPFHHMLVGHQLRVLARGQVWLVRQQDAPQPPPLQGFQRPPGPTSYFLPTTVHENSTICSPDHTSHLPPIPQVSVTPHWERLRGSNNLPLRRLSLSRPVGFCRQLWHSLWRAEEKGVGTCTCRPGEKTVRIVHCTVLACRLQNTQIIIPVRIADVLYDVRCTLHCTV